MFNSAAKNTLSRWIIALVFVCLTVAGGYSQLDKSYIGMRIPVSGDPRVTLLADPPYLGLHMGGLRSSVLKMRVQSMKRETVMDSTGQQFEFREAINGIDVGFKCVAPLNQLHDDSFMAYSVC